MSPYLDREMIESIFRAVGLDPVADDELGEEEEISEEVGEDIGGDDD